MENQGWVRMWRKLEDWEWYKTPNMAHLFQHLIRRANHEENNWQGIIIKRGQLITSLDSLKSQTGISIRSLRTCLRRLSDTNEVIQKTTNQYRLITICKYNAYQSPYNHSDKQATSARQASDKRATTNKNEKNEKNEKNKFFALFWSKYPKKVAKKAAIKAFNKLNPDRILFRRITKSLDEQIKSEQWSKENGQFIPYPSTWLNGERWADNLLHKESIADMHERLKAKGKI